jgi:Double zinc ribbon
LIRASSVLEFPFTPILPMPDCPKCRQTVEVKAITCPYCQTPLKAYGHPGIPLHQAIGGESLCPTCAYDRDDSCNYPQRPHALNCTMYQPIEAIKPAKQGRSGAKAVAQYQPATFPSGAWWQRNQSWVWLVGLFVVIFLVKLAGF